MVDVLVEVNKCCAIVHNFLIESKVMTLAKIKAYLGILDDSKSEGVLLGAKLMETMESHMYSAQLIRDNIMDYIKCCGRAYIT